ncbi:MAG: acyltransferase family protein [Pseudomonadota bacterium]
MGERSAYFDNTRAVLICLVVLGHCLELVRADAPAGGLYALIYSFHMPLFAFVSGACSRPDAARRHGSQALFWLAVTTVVCELLEFFIHGRISRYTASGYPYWALWWLWSLGIWRCTLPLLSRTVWAIPLSVVLALAVSVLCPDGYFLGIARTTYFWPFFLVGYFYRDAWLRLRGKIKPGISCAVLLAMALQLQVVTIPVEILYGSYTAPALFLDAGTMAGFRLQAYILAAIAGIAVLAVVPQSVSWVTRFGKRTLWVFLGHVLVLRFLPLKPLLVGMDGVGARLVLCVLLAGALVFLFSGFPGSGSRLSVPRDA